MRSQRRNWCCRAARKPTIRAECSKDQRSNSRNADPSDFRCEFSNGCYLHIAPDIKRGAGTNDFHRCQMSMSQPGNYLSELISAESGDFEQRCGPHASANTHGGHHVFYATTLPLKQSVPDLSRTCHAVGVANRYGTAVHVVDFGIDPKMVAAIENLAGEGFVKLPKANVVMRRPAVFSSFGMA